MQQAWDRAKPGGRCGPALITLSDRFSGRQAVFTAFKMPGVNKFYVALGVSSEIMDKIAKAVGLPAKDEILSREIFTDMALDSLYQSKAVGPDMSMTLLDFAPTQEQKQKFGAEGW